MAAYQARHRSHLHQDRDEGVQGAAVDALALRREGGKGWRLGGEKEVSCEGRNRGGGRGGRRVRAKKFEGKGGGDCLQAAGLVVVVVVCVEGAWLTGARGKGCESFASRRENTKKIAISYSRALRIPTCDSTPPCESTRPLDSEK